MTIDSQPQSVSFLLNYTTRNIRRYVSEILARDDSGITIDQWGALKILHECHDSLSNGDLSRRMLKDQPTVTRIVDILVRENLVQRVSDTKDRRRLRIRLTAAGRHKITNIGPLVQNIRADLSSGMTDTDRQALLRILGKLNDTIDELRASGSEPNGQ